MPTVTYTADIDTMLQQANPSTSFGNTTKIGVDTGSNAEQQVLLGFTSLFGDGPGQIPLGATITSATLTLQTTNSSNRGGSLHRMLVGWTEQSTWNSLGNGIQFDGTEAVATGDLVTGAVATGSRDFNVIESLQAWAEGAPNYGWAFKANGTDGWDFYSSEGTTKPLLTVTYTTETIPVTPVVSIQNAAQTEGWGARMLFTVTLNQAAGQNGVVVNYETVDGTAKAAVGTTANDFVGVTNGTITFAQGETTKTIEIAVNDDSVQEGSETFSVRLTSATNVAVSSNSGTATGTILDNDGTSPPPPIRASVVRITDTTSAPYKSVDATGYGSGDPSGLAYVPGMDTLFIADSEHDESPYYSSTNLFSIGPNGVVGAYKLAGLTKEPTGLAYNPANGKLYITDDDRAKVFWVDPANPTVKLGEFSTAAYGDDPEDPKFDPVTGHLFMLDGVKRVLYELTANGELVDSMNLPSVLTDAEALAYDSRHDVFFVASGASSKIWEMDRSGNVLATIEILANYRHPSTGSKPVPKGLELAPSSDPNDNKMSLFVADYGADQRNDGRLFEIDLGPDWLVA